MSWLAEVTNKSCLRQAIANHLPTFLRSIAMHRGDLHALALDMWRQEVASAARFGSATVGLSCDQIRYVLEDYLRDTYRTHAARADLSLALREIKRPAIVFSDEHGACLLVRDNPRNTLPRVVGSGLQVFVANPQMRVVAPTHAWLELDVDGLLVCA